MILIAAGAADPAAAGSKTKGRPDMTAKYLSHAAILSIGALAMAPTALQATQDQFVDRSEHEQLRIEMEAMQIRLEALEEELEARPEPDVHPFTLRLQPGWERFRQPGWMEHGKLEEMNVHIGRAGSLISNTCRPFWYHETKSRFPTTTGLWGMAFSMPTDAAVRSDRFGSGGTMGFSSPNKRSNSNPAGKVCSDDQRGYRSRTDDRREWIRRSLGRGSYRLSEGSYFFLPVCDEHAHGFSRGLSGRVDPVVGGCRCD
jgi:hypothetical protein